MGHVTAIIMIGSSGPGAREQMVAAARRAAATDSLAALSRIPTIDRIVVACPEPVRSQVELPPHAAVEWDLDPAGHPFHFGQRLSGLIEKHKLTRCLYLGAGSLPLLPEPDLADLVMRVADSHEPFAIANNLHSADWVAFAPADSVHAIAHWLERDNMLAWRLRHDLGFRVDSLPASAFSRTDIDTPFDLQLLALHPRTALHLRAYLESQRAHLTLDRFHRALAVLNTPGSRVTLIGRAASAAWRALEGAQVWTRVLSEERGMVANRRQAEGQVFSLLADYAAQIGEAEFIARLSRVSDLILFDTRVYMAHHKIWPGAEERFAADLGQSGAVSDVRLRKLVEAVEAAPIPILMGGHNVVSGGVFGLLEIADSRPGHQP